MTRAAIGFVNGKMIGKLARVILRVLLRSAATVLFVHPRNHADGSSRFEMKLPNQMRCFHRHRHARTIIDRARPQLPRIEMTRDDYDLLGMFAALEVGDDICAFDIRQCLWGEYKMHARLSLRGEVGYK